jgi:hypothetical protein
MRHSRPFWWRHSAVPALLLTLAPVAASRAPHVDVSPTAAAVRPRVAVRVAIESALYRKKLDGNVATCGQNCAALERALSDTLRAMFEERYRFADWSSGSASRDTVSVRLIQRNATNGPVTLVMSLAGRARQFMHAPEEVEFESWVFATTMRAGSDWTPDRLLAAWGDSLGRRLDSFTPRLLANVIGRLPLTGAIAIHASQSAADVQVSADSLRAATSPAPKFLIRLAMPSRTATGDVVPDTGELVLEACRRTTRGFYACELGGFTWRDRSGSDSLFREKAREARVTTASVHLQEYTPLSSSLSAGGLAAPRNP